MHVHYELRDLGRAYCIPVHRYSVRIATGYTDLSQISQITKTLVYRPTLFLSMTDTYVRMQVHCKNRSFIQSLALMRSAIMHCISMSAPERFTLFANPNRASLYRL